MCDFSSKIPTVGAPPPPPAPTSSAKLADPLGTARLGTNPDGTPIRRNSGLSSLRIDRTGGSGLNVPNT